MILTNPSRSVEVIKCALGEVMADIVIQDGMIVNVFTKELIKNTVAIKSGRIARINNCDDVTGVNTEIIEADGKIVSPGFIESHIHVESSMLTLTQFCAATVIRGTTTIVIDPHEIANVLGVKGVKLLLKEREELPFRCLVEVPSCVPAVADFENAGANLDVEAVAELLKEDTFALAEMMNFPGVLLCVPEVLQKINAAHRANKIVEGHAPGISGKELNAYISAGISSDHETTTVEEALEKLRLGIKLQIREGSFAKDL
ncbi:MAG: amidohydrolase family protein, partial [Promethearchaeota archaeon]